MKTRVAPAAVLGNLFQFYRWHHAHPELHLIPDLDEALQFTDSNSFGRRYAAAVTHVQALYATPVLQAVPHFPESSESAPISYQGLPASVEVLKSWPVDCLPNQRQITAQFIHKTYDELLATSSPTDRARMEAVGKYELPVVEPRRPNSLFFSDSTQKSSIYHAPMAYMALTTCQLLSDDCLSITASPMRDASIRPDSVQGASCFAFL